MMLQHHPDKEGGCKENFQLLSDFYQLARKKEALAKESNPGGYVSSSLMLNRETSRLNYALRNLIKKQTEEKRREREEQVRREKEIQRQLREEIVRQREEKVRQKRENEILKEVEARRKISEQQAGLNIPIPADDFDEEIIFENVGYSSTQKPQSLSTTRSMLGINRLNTTTNNKKKTVNNRVIKKFAAQLKKTALIQILGKRRAKPNVLTTATGDKSESESHTVKMDLEQREVVNSEPIIFPQKSRKSLVKKKGMKGKSSKINQGNGLNGARLNRLGQQTEDTSSTTTSTRNTINNSSTRFLKVKKGTHLKPQNSKKPKATAAKRNLLNFQKSSKSQTTSSVRNLNQDFPTTLPTIIPASPVQSNQDHSSHDVFSTTTSSPRVTRRVRQREPSSLEDNIVLECSRDSKKLRTSRFPNLLPSDEISSNWDNNCRLQRENLGTTNCYSRQRIPYRMHVY